jgi:cellulose synthase/poly-beta-1,6-N-acetylglucosamine synthase-like glycosyltransferase
MSLTINYYAKLKNMISVILPVYNNEKTISLCLNSLLNQNYKGKYEIIAVDDGSTDRSAEIIKKHRKVRLIRQTHKGPAVARNLGAKKSRGDVLLFTDADCQPDRNWIREMAKPFENPEITGVQGRYKTKQKELVAKFVQFEIEDRYEKMGKHKYIDFIGSYSAGYKKEVFLKEGGFDKSFPIASGEDPELSFRLSKKGYKMVFNPKAIVYHKHPDTLRKYLKQKFWRAYWRVLLYKKHKKKAVKESYTPQILKIEIGLFYLIFISLFFSISISVILSILLFIFTLPLSCKIFKKDRKIGLISPFVLILRTAVFSLGLIYGFISVFIKQLR